MTKKAITDLGDKVTDAEKKNAEAKIKAVEDALKGDDLDRIKSAKEELEKSAQALSERVYKEQQTAQNNQSQTNSESDEDTKKQDDDVFDADYKEV